MGRGAVAEPERSIADSADVSALAGSAVLMVLERFKKGLDILRGESGGVCGEGRKACCRYKYPRSDPKPQRAGST